MNYISMNATEERLEELARQMRIANALNVLQQLRDAGEIDVATYIAELKGLHEVI